MLESGELGPELPKLADSAGPATPTPIPVSYPTPRHEPVEGVSAERVRAALRAAWDYWRLPQLHQRAIDYLAGRGLDVRALEERVGPVVGHTPAAIDGLSQRLLNKGFTEEELIAAGLSQRSNQGPGLIDAFRHRVMLAFSDEAGPTGFIGRYDGNKPEVLEKWRYKNSPNTPLIGKSECLFWPAGLPRTGDRVVVVEGSMDALAVAVAAQAAGRLDGTKRIVPVAPSGVAMSDAQWQVIAKAGPSRVAIAPDNDETGRRTATEWAAAAQAHGLDARVVTWPEATKDAAELLAAQGPDAVLAALGAREAPMGVGVQGPDPFAPVPTLPDMSASLELVEVS